MASSPITSWQQIGKQWKQWDFIFLDSKITADGDCSHEIKRCLLLGRKAMTNLDSILNNRDITLSTKIQAVKAMFFSSSHVWMWELDYKESWVPKNWCFWTVVFEKTLESPRTARRSTVLSKGNQSWIFIGRTDAEAETPNFGHLMGRADSFEKTLMLGKIEGRRRKGRQRMRWLDGWHHRLNGHRFGWTPKVGDGQGGLVCCSSWGRKESDTTERLNWTEFPISC